MLGTPDVLDHADCDLPVDVQVGRLELLLAERFGDRPSVTIVDLYGLEGAERDEALDAVVAGEPSPFVLVAGHLVGTGTIDAAAIVASLSGASRAVAATDREGDHDFIPAPG